VVGLGEARCKIQDEKVGVISYSIGLGLSFNEQENPILNATESKLFPN
jgi:hypothetical protein